MFWISSAGNQCRLDVSDRTTYEVCAFHEPEPHLIIWSGVNETRWCFESATSGITRAESRREEKGHSCRVGRFPILVNVGFKCTAKVWLRGSWAAFLCAARADLWIFQLKATRSCLFLPASPRACCYCCPFLWTFPCCDRDAVPLRISAAPCSPLRRPETHPIPVYVFLQDSRNSRDGMTAQWRKRHRQSVTEKCPTWWICKTLSYCPIPYMDSVVRCA